MKEDCYTMKAVFVTSLLLIGVMIIVLYNSNMFIFPNIPNVSEIAIFEHDMAIRRNIMQTACKANGLDVRGEDSLHQPISRQYIIAKQNNTNLVWCPVFKAASTR